MRFMPERTGVMRWGRGLLISCGCAIVFNPATKSSVPIIYKAMEHEMRFKRGIEAELSPRATWLIAKRILQPG